MTMTKAELEQRIRELEAQNAQLKRSRFYGALFENTKRRKDTDPTDTGNIRIEVGGQPLWLDLSMWHADPSRYDSDTPPRYSLCASPMPEQYAAKAEAQYQASRQS